MIDPNAQAGYERALERVGTVILFRRVSGFAPNTATFDAVVRAVFRAYAPATPKGPSEFNTTGIAVSQGQREFIVLAADLAAKRFPLPLKKNDSILTGAMVGSTFTPSGEVFNITEVDAGTREIAGAIVGKAEGVA
jgi:hypothetical protein